MCLCLKTSIILKAANGVCVRASPMMSVMKCGYERKFSVGPTKTAALVGFGVMGFRTSKV
jgi:hypothetical protein